MNAPASRFKVLLVATLCAGLASCATAPPTEPETLMTPDEKARMAELQGAYARAADYWLQAAVAATGTASQTYRLNAAEAWLESGDRKMALAALDELQLTSMSPTDQQRHRLLMAEQALAEGDIATALDQVGQQQDWLSPALERRAGDIRNRIERLQSGAGSELLERISLDLGPAKSFSLTDAAALLAKYEYVPSGKLLEASLLSDINPHAASWAELMAKLRQGMLQEELLVQTASNWAADHPQHEVGRDEFLELAYLYSQRFSAPASIAVLLPTRGGLSAAGTAIRDGVLSAFLQSPGMSELKFYESGESPAEALSAYRQAFQNGADWVVGPVRQESVQAVAQLDLPGTSTFALNELADSTGPTDADRFFTLSLSQEAEAAAIARKMLQAGIEKVITLTADSAWGNRMEVAFVDAFTGGGGQVVDVASFSVSANDHSAELTRVLRIEQSRNRKDRLQAMLGTALSFEPRLRDDFDAFFLSSIPEQARQIRPQLRFFEAGEKPLYAVSRVYSGIPDPTADRDLNGTILPLSKLQLQAATSSPPEINSVRGGSMLNLYALGTDAWDLLRWLPLFQLDPDLSFPGASGQLKLAGNGQIDREPAWAMFVAGQPVAHDPAIRPEE